MTDNKQAREKLKIEMVKKARDYMRQRDWNIANAIPGLMADFAIEVGTLDGAALQPLDDETGLKDAREICQRMIGEHRLSDAEDKALTLVLEAWNRRQGSLNGGFGAKVSNRTAWMIERNSSLWGCEWFCAGGDRWTKDPNKTIQFPDRGSAEEVWRRLIGEETKEFPYVEEVMTGVYTINITEHAWFVAGESDGKEEM